MSKNDSLKANDLKNVTGGADEEENKWFTRHKQDSFCSAIEELVKSDVFSQTIFI